MPVTVDEPGWTSPPATYTYTGPAPGGLTLFRDSGARAGGDTVSISGSSLNETVSGVHVDGVSVPFRLTRATGPGGRPVVRVNIVTPAHAAAGPVPVTVDEPGWISPPATYTYR